MVAAVGWGAIYAGAGLRDEEVLDHDACGGAACGDEAAPAIAKALFEEELLGEGGGRVEEDVAERSAASAGLGRAAAVGDVAFEHVAKVEPGIVAQVSFEAADGAVDFDAIVGVGSDD